LLINAGIAWFILANGALFWLLLGRRPDAPARDREDSASG
jgi:hypothetical protein